MGKKMYTLEKKNFPTFVGMTQGFEYEVDRIHLRAFTCKERELIKNMIIGGFSRVFEATYGLPVTPFATDYVKVGDVDDFYILEGNADFEKLQIAHKSKRMNKFVLARALLKPSAEAKADVLVTGIEIIGTSLANPSLTDNAELDGLYDKCKPQDYYMTFTEVNGTLETGVKNLFEEFEFGP